MSIRFRVLIVFTAFTLSACGKQEPGPEAVSEQVPLWLEALPDCTDKQITTLHWTTGLVKKGSVDIHVGEASNAPLFGHVGGPGSKQTGAWTKPGTLFVARDNTGKEIARATATGPGCP